MLFLSALGRSIGPALGRLGSHPSRGGGSRSRHFKHWVQHSCCLGDVSQSLKVNVNCQVFTSFHRQAVHRCT